MHRALSSLAAFKTHRVAAASYLLGATKLPAAIRCDLRPTGLLSPVENQGELGSCTAHAVIGLVEYLLRSGAGEERDMSR